MPTEQSDDRRTSLRGVRVVPELDTADYPVTTGEIYRPCFSAVPDRRAQGHGLVCPVAVMNHYSMEIDGSPMDGQLYAIEIATTGADVDPIVVQPIGHSSLAEPSPSGSICRAGRAGPGRQKQADCKQFRFHDEPPDPRSPLRALEKQTSETAAGSHPGAACARCLYHPG